MRRELTSTTADSIDPRLSRTMVPPISVSGLNDPTAQAVVLDHDCTVDPTIDLLKPGYRRMEAALQRTSRKARRGTVARGRPGVWIFIFLVLPWLTFRPLMAFGLTCLALLCYVVGQLAFGEYGPDGKL